MDFSLTEEQTILAQSLDRQLEAAFDHEVLRRNLAEGITSTPENYARLVEAGAFAMPLPEAAGGFDGGGVDVMIIAQTLGKRLSVEPFISAAVASASVLAGSDSGRAAKLLAAIGVGEEQIALALYEPGERHDPTALGCRAVETEAGFSLNGHKAVVLGADTATTLLVSAALDGKPAVFAVKKGAKGLTLRPYALLDGRGAADVIMDGAETASDALIALGEAAEDLIAQAVDRAAAALVADSIGAIEEIAAITEDYLKTRTQFGRPIGSFQVLAHRMADLLVELEQARSLAMEAAVEADNKDATARAKAVSAAKAKVGAVARQYAKDSIQMHGGIGMTDEYILSAYVKRLLTNELLFGDTDYHFDRFASLGLAAA